MMLAKCPTCNSQTCLLVSELRRLSAAGLIEAARQGGARNRAETDDLREVAALEYKIEIVGRSMRHYSDYETQDIIFAVPTTANCPCCQKWYHNSEPCSGCPISEFTGKDHCGNTPYRSVDNAWLALREAAVTWRAAARTERFFLERVRNELVEQRDRLLAERK